MQPAVNPAAGWIARITMELLERVVSHPALIDRYLRTPREYSEAPHIERDGEAVVATFHAGPLSGTTSQDLPRMHARAPRGPARVTLLDRRDPRFPIASLCTCGAASCAHAGALLADLAAHQGLREAVASGGPSEPYLDELEEARARALDDRTVQNLIDTWVPKARPRHAKPLEVSVDVIWAGLEGSHPYGYARDPMLEVRFREQGERAQLGRADLEEASRDMANRRLFDLVNPMPAGKKVFCAMRLEASLLLHLLRDRRNLSSGSFKEALHFSSETVSPHVEAMEAAHAGAKVKLASFWQLGTTQERYPMVDGVLFSGPHSYVWIGAKKTFYPVDPNVDIAFAESLQLRPVIELEPRNAMRLGRVLMDRGRGRGVALPPPETFGLKRNEAPRLVLRLDGMPLTVRGSLEAIYSHGSFRIDVRTNDETEGRDLELEDAALTRVRAIGLTPVVDEDSGEASLAADLEKALALWETGLATLRASGPPVIDVLLSPLLAGVKSVARGVGGRVRIRLEEGWLDAKLEFNVADVRIELNVLRAAIRAQRRWILLENGTLATIDDDLIDLLEDAESVMPNTDEARLPMHQLGRVTRWLDAFGGEIDDEVHAFRARLRALAVAPEPHLPKRLDATLRPYQREGVAWLQFLQSLGAGGILADDMGLGKTITTLTFLAYRSETEGQKPSLVVCPTSVAGNWVREAARFTPGLRVVLMHGKDRAARAPEIASADLVVTTYALLRHDLETLREMPFRCVILDEAQNIKNSEAVTTLAASKLDAQMRIALSGTPIENRLRELWSILNFCNPGMLGEAINFERRFERGVIEQPKGATAEHLRAVVRPFILRRTKSEVLLDLPPKTEMDHPCLLSRPQKKLYDALALALREAIGEKIEKRGWKSNGMIILTALLRLRQMACDPRLVDPKSDGPSAKREAFLDLVRELAAEGRRALVFSQFVDLLALWRQDLDREGIRYEYLDGSTIDRGGAVDRFQNGDAPLFLISLKAGGAGLNLTAADTVIHIDPWWNPAVEDQATDRAHRIGQARSVSVIRLIALGTIEEKIGILKQKKRALADAVVGATAGALRGLTEEDLKDLLGDAEVEPRDPHFVYV